MLDTKIKSSPRYQFNQCLSELGYLILQFGATSLLNFDPWTGATK
jgi:hypothetical protein